MAKTLTVELPDETYRALEVAAEQNGSSPESEAAKRLIQSVVNPGAETAVDEELMRRGLLRRIPSGNPQKEPRFFLDRQLDPPLSETIIEERR